MSSLSSFSLFLGILKPLKSACFQLRAVAKVQRAKTVNHIYSNSHVANFDCAIQFIMKKNSQNCLPVPIGCMTSPNNNNMVTVASPYGQ